MRPVAGESPEVRVRGRFVTPVLAGLMTAATFHWVCNLVFRCGCAWFFAGGAEHCNMHDPAPPNCPVCTSLVWGVPFSLAVLGAWLGLLSLPRRLSSSRGAR